MICTDTLGVLLKTGNLNSACKIRLEAVGPKRTEALYVYALSGAELGSKYTAGVGGCRSGSEAMLSLIGAPVAACRRIVGAAA
jgi:hypothetical protein